MLRLGGFLLNTKQRVPNPISFIYCHVKRVNLKDLFSLLKGHNHEI